MRKNQSRITVCQAFISLFLASSPFEGAHTLWGAVPITRMELRHGTLTVIAIPTPEAQSPELARSVFLHAGLASDLRNSGAFQVKDFQALVAADTVDSPISMDLKTTLRSIPTKGLRVETKLRDHASGKILFSKAYFTAVEAMRKVAHRISDDIVGRVTGIRGLTESRIVFARRVPADIKEIFSIDQDGENLHQLTHYGSMTVSLSISKDGRLAYLTYKGGPPEIWGQMKPGDRFERLYSQGTHPGGSITSPVWDPDNLHLAFIQGNHRGDSDIHVMEV